MLRRPVGWQRAAGGTDRCGAALAFDAGRFKAHMRFNEERRQAGAPVASDGFNPVARGARLVVSQGLRAAAGLGPGRWPDLSSTGLQPAEEAPCRHPRS